MFSTQLSIHRLLVDLSNLSGDNSRRAVEQ